MAKRAPSKGKKKVENETMIIIINSVLRKITNQNITFLADAVIDMLKVMQEVSVSLRHYGTSFRKKHSAKQQYNVIID